MESKNVDLQTAITTARAVMHETTVKLMRTYGLPGYIMDFVLTDVLATVRSETIEDMVVAASVASKKEEGIDENNKAD